MIHAYSLNGEDWSDWDEFIDRCYNDIDEPNLVGTNYYMGDMVPVVASDAVTSYVIDSLLDNLDATMSDKLGEYYDGDAFYSVGATKKEELSKILSDWVNANVTIRDCYVVEDVKEMVLTATDVD